MRFILLAPSFEGSVNEGRLAGPSRTFRWENFTEDIRVRPRAEQLLAAARTIPGS
jgi:hypothetical protein